MEWFQAAVLGVIQGLTEFLPISSSAHLRIYPELFGWEDPGASFTAVTQIGTEAAVILYFAKDIASIVTSWFRSLFARRASRGGHAAAPIYDEHAARMGWYVIIGTIPIVIVGLLLQETIRDDFRSLWIVGTTLIVLGIILGICDRVGSKDRGERQIRLRDAILVGSAQTLALVPGVSRSGASISAGLLLGLDRAAAARFAFLLAIPAVLGAGFFEWPEALSEESVYGTGPLVLATVIAFLVGYAVVAWLLRYLSRGSFAPFVIYRIALGALTLVLLSTGTLTP